MIRLRLHLALMGSPGNHRQLAQECANALTLEGEPVADLATLIDTTLLLRRAHPQLMGPELLDEAVRATRQLGNKVLERELHAEPRERCHSSGLTRVHCSGNGRHYSIAPDAARPHHLLFAK